MPAHSCCIPSELGKLLMVLPVQPVEHDGIDQDEHDKHDDAALLGEPESERNAPEGPTIERVRSQHPGPEASNCPDKQ